MDKAKMAAGIREAILSETGALLDEIMPEMLGAYQDVLEQDAKDGKQGPLKFKIPFVSVLMPFGTGIRVKVETHFSIKRKWKSAGTVVDPDQMELPVR